MRKLLVVPAVLALCAGPAAAQSDLEGLVNVNIQDVLQDIAVDLNVEENNIPVTVQLPVSVAANVCDVNVGVLSAQVESGDASCAAVTGSQELTQVVQQEMAAGGATDDDVTTGSTDDGTAADEGTADEGTTDGGTAADEGATADNGASDDGATGTVDTEEDTTGTAGTEDDATGTDEGTTGSISGASEFAPGQQEAPANEVAPGQQEEPREAAPGQVMPCAPGQPNCQ